MKMKFLAPPLSLAFLLFGLSYVDAAELKVRKPPRVPQVEVFSSDRPYYIALEKLSREPQNSLKILA